MRFGLLACGLLAAACGGGDAVRIFAAASLTDVLPSIVERYREQHPDVDFEFSFAGSQTLAAQIEEGAPADVFISALPVHARRLVDAGLAERPLVLAENRLVVAVREDAPWQTVGELAAAGVRVAVGAPNVPVGALTESALGSLDPSVAAWVREHVVTQDPTVRVVLSRVELGEAEAAFVYHTDLAAAPALRAITLPGTPNNEYVAVLVPGDGGVDERAVAFLDFLDSDEARALLVDAGFLPASSGRSP